MRVTVPFQLSLRILRSSSRLQQTHITAWQGSIKISSPVVNLDASRQNYNVNSLSSRILYRNVSTSQVLSTEKEMVDVTFITPDGTKHKTKGKLGDNLLDVVVNNNVDLDGFGACEGTLACSTCHLVFKQEDFDKIKDKVTDEELDMLDLAYGLTERSRLGCQVTLTKELAGVEVEVPAGVNDARS